MTVEVTLIVFVELLVLVRVPETENVGEVDTVPVGVPLYEGVFVGVPVFDGVTVGETLSLDPTESDDVIDAVSVGVTLEDIVRDEVTVALGVRVGVNVFEDDCEGVTLGVLDGETVGE